MLVLIAGPALAQKTKKVVIKSDYPSTKETYYVLKSDENIKHGEYKKKFHGKSLKKGEYVNNERTGIWEYYNLSGDVIHKVNVESMEIVYDKLSTEKSEFNSDLYSRPFIILGGFEPFFTQIAYLLRYPAVARRNGTQGKVYIKLLFNNKGLIESAEVVEGIGDGLDEEALRVIKLIDIETIPALDLKGEPTSSDFIFPINFQLG